MGWLARLFGQCGTVRFEGETYDGKVFDGKLYVEAFGMDNEDLEQKLKDIMYVEKGVRVKSITITAFVENYKN